MNERATAAAHRVVAEVVREGEVVIDATAGNGHDTVFLAGLVGERGRVLAFDVQAAAIKAARRRVAGAGLSERVGFFHESHAGLGARADEVAAVMFNLGYLPGADHSVITRTPESLWAIEAALGILRPGGVVTVVCYPGHPGGDEEAEAVAAFARGAGGEVREAAREGAPFLVVLRAAADGHRRIADL